MIISYKDIPFIRAKACLRQLRLASLDWADLTCTTDNILEARQLLNANGTARMHFTCGDADLRPHAKLAAVCKLRRRIVQDNG